MCVCRASIVWWFSFIGRQPLVWSQTEWIVGGGGERTRRRRHKTTVAGGTRHIEHWLRCEQSSLLLVAVQQVAGTGTARHENTAAAAADVVVGAKRVAETSGNHAVHAHRSRLLLLLNS